MCLLLAAHPEELFPARSLIATSFPSLAFPVRSTNSSYGRWDEARKMWGQVVNRSRDIARQVGRAVPLPVYAMCECSWVGWLSLLAVAEATTSLFHNSMLPCCNLNLLSCLPFAPAAGGGLHPRRPGAPAGRDLPLDHRLHVSGASAQGCLVCMPCYAALAAAPDGSCLRNRGCTASFPGHICSVRHPQTNLAETA